MRKVEGAQKTRHARGNGASSNGHGDRHAQASIGEVLEMGRGLPRKLHRNMDAHPVAILAAVGGASFLAGAVLGSRFGRALLLAAIPIALERLVASELAPRLWSYVEGLIRTVDSDPTRRDPAAA
jgi:hypothetical protein